jgi:hypothetical protein
MGASERVDIVNGCTVVAPSEAPELVAFGPAETRGAYRILIGALAPGQPEVPLHVPPPHRRGDPRDQR